MPLADYIQKCIGHLESMSERGMLNGLGKLMDEDMKKFARNYGQKLYPCFDSIKNFRFSPSVNEFS